MINAEKLRRKGKGCVGREEVSGRAAAGFDHDHDRIRRRVLKCRKTAADLARLREYVEILSQAATGADGVGLVTAGAKAFVREMADEITVRHGRGCALVAGTGPCDCDPEVCPPERVPHPQEN
jgi:hypothetical protein